MTTATPTAPEAPERTITQRMEALARANEIRRARARIKKDIAAGRTRLVDVIAQPPDYALTMRVRVLLRVARGLGDVKVDQIMGRCRISPAKTLGGLSRRQRDDLVDTLTARESR